MGVMIVDGETGQEKTDASWVGCGALTPHPRFVRAQLRDCVLCVCVWGGGGCSAIGERGGLLSVSSDGSYVAVLTAIGAEARAAPSPSITHTRLLAADYAALVF